MSEKSIIVLDGGMGRELERIGAPFSQPFWSAQALMEAPEMVAEAHRNFILSGAQLITTNSYAVIPSHIGEDLFNDDGSELINLSGKLARQEADKAPSSVRVAACVPPVFGSYMPEKFDKEAAPELLFPFFEEQDVYADLFLAETISSVEEAMMIGEVYQESGFDRPLWLSFTLEEFFDEAVAPKLRSKEDLDVSIEKILEMDIAEAVLFNCCSVEDINAALDVFAEVIGSDKRIKTGGYANAFGRVKGKRSPTGEVSILRDDITPETYLEYAQEWAQKGACIIGGCCGIGPEYIKLISEYFKKQGI